MGGSLGWILLRSPVGDLGEEEGERGGVVEVEVEGVGSVVGVEEGEEDMEEEGEDPMAEGTGVEEEGMVEEGSREEEEEESAVDTVGIGRRSGKSLAFVSSFSFAEQRRADPSVVFKGLRGGNLKVTGASSF